MDDIPVNDGVPVHDEGPLDDSAPVKPCDDCGRTAAGQYSKDRDFYCFDCWQDWDPDGDDMEQHIRDPDSIPFHEYMYKNNYDYDKIKDRFNPERPFGTAIPNMIIQYGIYKGQRPISRTLFYKDTKLFDLFMDHGANPLLKDRKYKLSAKDFVEDCKGFLSFAVKHGLAAVGDKKYLQLTKNCKYYNKRINLYMTTAAKKIQTKARSILTRKISAATKIQTKARSKLTKKKSAATKIQSKIRGKQTRSKFKKYKHWIGTEAFDTIEYDDEDVFTYLRKSDRNFVIKLPGSDTYEAWNIDQYLKLIEIEGAGDINTFYECYEASGNTPEHNINKDTIYIKLSSSIFVVEMPDWLLPIRRNLGPNNKIPEPRIFGLVENKMVNALVSTKLLHYLEQTGNYGADHCNQRKPLMTYKLVLLNEETMQADFLRVLDEYGAQKKKKKKKQKKKKKAVTKKKKKKKALL
jgi:hypothetical protein